MINQRTNSNLESGQSIPLIVLLFFVIIGMVALILDGGAVMSNRRIAQAAADAAALAGAQRACSGKSDAETVAENYAIKNGATSQSVTVDGAQVTVQVTVEHPSFFAKIFGKQTLRATAEATAGCYGVKGKSVVPLAWYCAPPDPNNLGPFNPEYGCKMQTLNWKHVQPLIEGSLSSLAISDFDGNNKDYYMSGTNIVDSAGIPPEQIYIIIDSDKICLEDGGEIKCDLDGDGKKDIQLGGDRGWLYLTADTSDISQWLTGTDFPVSSHVWLSGKSGVSTSVYIKMIDLGFPGNIALIPVYNVLCDGDPRTDATCVEAAHASPPWPLFEGEDNFSEIRNTSLNYHIIAFAPFYVSCVDTKGSNCPGFAYAQTLNSDLTDGPVVEGFFLSDMKVSPDIKQDCSINLGNCTISLSK